MKYLKVTTVCKRTMWRFSCVQSQSEEEYSPSAFSVLLKPTESVLCFTSEALLPPTQVASYPSGSSNLEHTAALRCIHFYSVAETRGALENEKKFHMSEPRRDFTYQCDCQSVTGSKTLDLFFRNKSAKNAAPIPSVWHICTARMR